MRRPLILLLKEIKRYFLDMISCEQTGNIVVDDFTDASKIINGGNRYEKKILDNSYHCISE